MPNVRRRTFLLGGTAVAGGAALWSLPNLASAAAEPPLDHYPFTLGVASGDPLPDSVVLWTRLAPEPLSTGGVGRMPDGIYEVSWELATDAAFATVVASGVESATLADGYSVHAIPTGLPPGAWFHYRFKVQGHISAPGRTRTAPAPGTEPTTKVAMASCQHWEQGWYHAHRFLAADNPDLVLFLGDYVYEYPSNIYKAPSGRGVRSYSLHSEMDTLADYRMRYAQHKTDPNLQKAHAAAPWIVVFDDHEVKNNWAGNDPTTTSPEPGAPPIPATRKFAAFKAWWENMPTRMPKPTGAAITAYRPFQWGSLARFHMLDTRQFRNDQSPDGNCTTMRATSRSILGTAQEGQLLTALATPAAARWDFLAQQVFFAQRDSGGDSADCNDMSTDAWDGYDASRRRITQGWIDRQVRNPIVLTGDVHRHWAANLHLNYYTGGAVVGTEFVTSSISSLGSATVPDTSKMPHIRYIGNQRGYVLCTVSATRVLAEWIGISSALVKSPTGITRSVVRRYAVNDGVPGLATP